MHPQREPGAVPRPWKPERQVGGQAPWSGKSEARTCTRAPGRCFQLRLGHLRFQLPRTIPPRTFPLRRERGFLFVFKFFMFWPRCTAYEILVPRPGIEPVPLAVEERHLNHWTTREVLREDVKAFPPDDRDVRIS